MAVKDKAEKEDPKAAEPVVLDSEETLAKVRTTLRDFQGYDTTMSDLLIKALHRNGVHFTS